MEMLEALTVEEVEKNGEKKSYFTRIGRAMPSKDGTGWNVYLSALPVNGKILLRPKKGQEGP